MIAGRDFTDAETDSAPKVAIVNETLARQFWPGKDPVGQRLLPLEAGAAPDAVIVVVGVVRDSKYITVGEEPRSFLYLAADAGAHASRHDAGPQRRHARGRRDFDDEAGMRAVDGGLALFAVSTLDEAISISVLPARMAGGLLGALGMLALALAALGIYGVLSFLVRARTREIGVRVALGAAPRSVVGLVVRQAMMWTLSGMAIGVALALAASRLLGVAALRNQSDGSADVRRGDSVARERRGPRGGDSGTAREPPRSARRAQDLVAPVAAPISLF